MENQTESAAFAPHDPVVTPTVNLGPIDKWFLARLSDPRDLHGVHVTLAMTFTVIPAAVALYIPGVLSPWTLLGYYVLNFAVFLDRFVLMQHTQAHKPWFKRQHKLLNGYILNVLGLFFGQTLRTYFAHHVVMHHTEDNQPTDLSTTLPFKRDSFIDVTRYLGRFLTLGIIDLVLYFHRKGRARWRKEVLVGELATWTLIGLLALVNWKATIAVFVFPIFFTRWGMMLGNWAQHAFADANDPTNSYKTSCTIISSRHNRRCFNNGYHVVHHQKAVIHWADMPAYFARDAHNYDAAGAVIFKGVPSFQLVTIMLVLKRKAWLARRMVYADGTPLPFDEAMRRIEERTRPMAA